MSRAVPAFISRRLSRGQLHGYLDGAVLHVDVTGFTSLTERLMADGHRGAERVSRALNAIFEAVEAPIEDAGGFIATFAGDSFTAVFPDRDHDDVRPVADGIRSLLSQLDSKAGFRPEYRFCLSAGEMEWGITGGQGMRAYFFRGRPVFACSALAGVARPGELAVRAEGSVPGNPGSDVGDPPDLDAAFVPREALSIPGDGEFREVVSVFTGFDQEIPYGELDGLIRLLLQGAERFGGYLPGVFFDEKGGNALTVFGAPLSREDLGRRAVEYVSALCGPSHLGVRFGVCRGTVYAGRIGSRNRFTYSVIGDPVNTAAKLLNHCSEGEALFAGRVLGQSGGGVGLPAGGTVRLAGKSEPVAVFELPSKTEELPAVAVSAGELFGRERPLRRCLEAVREATRGPGPVVVHVRGEAGVGKSRLCSEVAARARAGFRGLSLRCDPLCRRGMKPLADMLRKRMLMDGPQAGADGFEEGLSSLLSDLSRTDDPRAPEMAEELRRGRSALRRLLGLPSNDSLFDSLEPAQRYSNTVFALKAYLKAESLVSPLLLLVEDLHWADPDTIEVLETLLRRLDGFPIALLATARPDDDGEYLSLAVPEGVPESVAELEGLSPQAARRLVAAKTGGTPSRRLLEFLRSRCRGNPLYLEQYCAYLIDHKRLRQSADGLVPDGAAAGMPEGIRSTLLARLDRLPPKLRGLVQTASVLGGEFQVDVLRAMRPGPEVPALLAAGTGLGIWTVASGRCTFTHVLIREAAYEMQLDRSLQRLHLAAAKVLKALQGSQAESWSRIAGHLERAGRLEEAGEYLLRAARYASEEYRSAEALELYDRYLACADGGDRRTRALREVASVCVVLGLWKRAEECFDAAIEAAGGDERLITSIRVEKADLLRRSSRMEEAAGLLKSTAREAVAAGGALQAEHTLKMARVRIDMGEYSKGLRLAEAARGAFLEHGCTGAAVSAGRAMGAALAAKGEYAAALDAYAKALEMLEGSRDPHTRAELLGSMGNVHLELKDYRRAEELYSSSLELAERAGHRQYVGFATGNLGIIKQLQGRFDRAEELLLRQRAIGEERGDRYTLGTSWINLCAVRVGQGRFREALKLARKAERAFGGFADRPGVSYCLYMSGSLLGLLGSRPKAEEMLRRAVSIGRECGLAPYLVDYLTALAWLRAEDGSDPAGALEAAREAVQTARTIGMEARGALAEAVVAMLEPEDDGEAVARLRRLGERADSSALRASVLYALHLVSGESRHADEARALTAGKEGPLETSDWRVLMGTGGPPTSGDGCR